MNKRVIINVATGEFYCKMQQRLIKSLEKNSIDKYIHHSGDAGLRFTCTHNIESNNGIDLIVWDNCLPPGSRPHSESPYGFKVHAIKAAYEMGYTSILWLDSAAYAVKDDISPIFDKMEKEGYYVMSHVDTLDNYVSDLTRYTFGLKHEQTKDRNLPSGTCYGFDLSKEHIKIFFAQFHTEERNGYFNMAAPHRHDETILALMMIKLGWSIFTFDPLFQSDSPECVIKSGGE